MRECPSLPQVTGYAQRAHFSTWRGANMCNVYARQQNLEVIGAVTPCNVKGASEGTPSLPTAWECPKSRTSCPEPLRVHSHRSLPLPSCKSSILGGLTEFNVRGTLRQQKMYGRCVDAWCMSRCIPNANMQGEYGNTSLGETVRSFVSLIHS